MLLCKTSYRDAEEMELKTASGLTLSMHSSGNQINLLDLSSVKYFAKEETIIIVYYLSDLLSTFKKFCASPSESSC